MNSQSLTERTFQRRAALPRSKPRILSPRNPVEPMTIQNIINESTCGAAATAQEVG